MSTVELEGALGQIHETIESIDHQRQMLEEVGILGIRAARVTEEIMEGESEE